MQKIAAKAVAKDVAKGKAPYQDEIPGWWVKANPTMRSAYAKPTAEQPPAKMARGAPPARGPPRPRRSVPAPEQPGFVDRFATEGPKEKALEFPLWRG